MSEFSTIFLTMNSCSQLKNDMFLDVLLYKLPRATFFFIRSANVSTSSPTLRGSLNLLHKTVSFVPLCMLFYLYRSIKIVDLPESFTFECFFLYSIRWMTTFLRWNAVFMFSTARCINFLKSKRLVVVALCTRLLLKRSF